MSNLDPAQGAAGEVFCASSNISSEIVSGQQFNPGDDIGGVGTIVNPYETVDQALREIRIFEGQASTTKKWKIWLITKAGEIGDYARTLRDQNVNYPETSLADPFYFVFESYNKLWGPAPTFKWDNINDKAIWQGFENVTKDQGIRLFQAANIHLKTDATKLIDLNCSLSGSAAIRIKTYGCRFSRLSLNSKLEFFGSEDLTMILSHMAGTFDLGCNFNVPLQPDYSSYLMNCLIDNAAVGDCIEFQDSNNEPSIMNCTFNCSGVGFYVYRNVGSTSVKSSLLRTGNTYNLKDGGGLAVWSTITPPEATFIPGSYGVQDVESQALDPLYVNPGEPELSNASLVFDKGMALGGVFLLNITDPTNENKHLVDAQGFRWGDQIGPESPDTANGVSKFSHRSPGPIQQPLGYVTEENVLVYAVGSIPSNTVYAVARVGTDADLAGTCQLQLIQADDSAGTTNVLKVDSSPVNVKATNKFVEISEDGAPDVTVSLVEAGYNTVDLHSHLQTRLNAAGLTGTYAVDYDSGTKKSTISATGLISGFELKFSSGVNANDSLARLFGFDAVDSTQSNSATGQNPVDQNFFDASLSWEWSDDYVIGQDPSVSGSWQAMGTEDPGDTGVEGTNGVSCTAITRFVRVDVGSVSPVNLKFHGFRAWNGNLRSESLAVI
jgi:hypothetical protein